MKKEMLEKIINSNNNLIVEGNTVTGKTTTVLFPIVENAINKKESLFIIDSKEEYLSKYYDKLKSNDYNTIIINLRDTNKSEGWNPCEYPYKLYKNGNLDKSLEYLEKIGSIIFHEDKSADPFWALTAGDFFIGNALGLFEDAKEDEINFNSINSMFNAVEKKFAASDYSSEYFKSKGESSKPYILASTTFMAPRDTKGSILAVAKQKLRLYVSREKLSQLLSKTTFNMEDIVNKPTAIIFIARDEYRTSNTIATMFIQQLYSILIDLKNKSKFHLVLDNFDVISECEGLSDILSSCVSRNVNTYIATRSLKDLTDTYGGYITNLCNCISLNEENEIDNNREITDYFEANSSVVYPTLEPVEVKEFDLCGYVDKNRTMMSMPEFPLPKPTHSVNIDDLIRNIDEKIAEIDAMSSDDEKSVFDQFRIDDTNKE